MPYLIALLCSFVFIGCLPKSTSVTNTLPSTEEALPTATLEDNSSNNSPLETFSTIEGKYSFIKGTRSFEGMHQTIENAQLVIEQLDDDDFGYYFITKIGQLPPNSSFGIFHQKGDNYVQKVIEDDENSTAPKVSIIENIQLTYEEPKLRLVIQARGKKNILWTRVNSDFDSNEEMKKALKEAKHDYIKFYKEKFPKVIDL